MNCQPIYLIATAGTVTSSGTVDAPHFDHVLYTEAQLVADGRIVHGLPSQMMLYIGLFENSGHLGWNQQRVEQVEECARNIRKLIYDTRRMKLLAKMRSLGHDC
jgi:hypothetical protein